MNWIGKPNIVRGERSKFYLTNLFTDSEQKRLKGRGKELGGLGYGNEYNKKSPFLDAAETDFENQFGDEFQGEDGATYGIRADFLVKTI